MFIVEDMSGCFETNLMKIRRHHHDGAMKTEINLRDSLRDANWWAVSYLIEISFRVGNTDVIIIDDNLIFTH
jgi:hypothetical protein